MLPQPEQKGVMTASCSRVLKLASVKSPEMVWGLARKTATAGFSSSSRRSHRLNTRYLPSAGGTGIFSTYRSTSSGVFLYLSPSTLPGMPQERKYLKSGPSSAGNPEYRTPPLHPIVSPAKEMVSPSAGMLSWAIMHRCPLTGRRCPAYLSSSE